MRCPYCGCTGGGCGFCEVEGWEKEVPGMEDPDTDPIEEKSHQVVDYFKMTCEILGYNPYDRTRID